MPATAASRRLGLMRLALPVIAPWSLCPGAALAQDTGPDTTHDIVVTAAKQQAPISQVPIAMIARTQADLDRQQIASVQDLARFAPGLTVTSSNRPNGANIGIRGMISSIGASTTGVYLDDIPLQRRTTLGQFSGSGVIFPQLVDLERVEVLKGPQGTLYGGSAEGGAIRFITPAPDLRKQRLVAKAELSGTQEGGINQQLSAAIGTPLVRDHLALRISLSERRDSGYLDHVDIYTGKRLGENTNGQIQRTARVALAWRASDRLTVAPSFYYTYQRFNDNDTYWENVPQTIVPTRSFNAAGAAYTGSNGPVAFTLPGHTYGPYNVFGPYRTGQNCNIGEAYKDSIAPCYRPSPRKSVLLVPSLTADYALKGADIHLSLAYIDDRNEGANDGSYAETASYQGGVPFISTLPQFSGNAIYTNRRKALTGELRLSSRAGAGIAWVGGLFASSQITNTISHDYTDMAAVAPALRGVSDVTLYGVAVLPDGDVSARYQRLSERELAVFGHVTVPVAAHLKAIGGLRVSQSRFAYDTTIYGSFFGYNTPTRANGGLSSGLQEETPVTPKFGLQYDLGAAGSGKAMLYATAAKGYRAGGVNTGAYQFKCQSTFDALGLAGTPANYRSDSLWSYEGGVKGSLLGGRLRFDASAYHIDWRNVQVNYTLPSPCGFSYTTNAGGAVSDGGDLQASLTPIPGLTADVALAVTRAHYTAALVGPSPSYSVLIPAGTALPTPSFQISTNLRYDFTVNRRRFYLGAAWQHANSYQSGYGPASSSYNIDTDRLPATNFVSTRAGWANRDLEIVLFVNNLFNSQDRLSRSGGRSCADPACATVRSYNPIMQDTTFRPRTFGLNLMMRR